MQRMTLNKPLRMPGKRRRRPKLNPITFRAKRPSPMRIVISTVSDNRRRTSSKWKPRRRVMHNGRKMSRDR